MMLDLLRGLIDAASYARILRLQSYADAGVLGAEDAWRVELLSAVAAVDGGP